MNGKVIMPDEDKKSRWDWLGRVPPPESPEEPKEADSISESDVTTPPKVDENFALLNEAYNFILDGRFNEAIEICNTILQKNPQNPDAWFYKSLAFLDFARQNENYNEYIKYCTVAAQCFEQLLRINPNHPEGLLWQGFILIDLERFTDSLELFERFLKSNPKDIRGLYGKSKVLYHLKRYREALTYVNEILNLDANFKEAEDLKQLCLMRKK